MEKNHQSSETTCLNCGATVTGNFCHECGQRVRDNLNRSLSRLLGEFFNNIFFFDNRFFISVRYLITSPGRMTVEFLEGSRKKFISPVTLFLFLNLIYFIVNPLSDYSLSLIDQIHAQPYSSWTKEWVDVKVQQEGLDIQDYAVTYQNTSDNVSKSIMIINIPMVAVFVYLITFKKRRFYFDSLIFSFHFFTLYIASWIMFDWVDELISLLAGNDNSMISAISFRLFIFFLPLLYAILSIRKFMNIRWYWAVPAGLGVIIGVAVANLLYRFIIFTIVFWTT